MVVRSRRRKPWAAVVAVMAAVALLVGCGADPAEEGTATPGADATAITIGLTYVPNVQFAPFYLALQRGYFADAGLDVELRHHGEAEDLFGALADGQEDVVVAGGDEVMQVRSQGSPVVSIATMYQRSPVALIVPEDSSITTPADMAGATIGIPGRFGQSWFGLLELLEQAGLTEDDVTISEIGYTQQVALAGDRVDAVVGFSNNDVPQFASTGLDVRAVTGDPLPIVSVGLATTEDLLAADPDAMRGVLDAVGRAVADITVDPSLAVTASLEEIPGTVPADQEAVMAQVAEATVELYGDPDAPFGQQDAATWEAMATAMVELGLVAEPVPAQEAYTDELVGSG